MLQRRTYLLHTHLKVKKMTFPKVARTFEGISSESLHGVVERFAQGDNTTAYSEQERQVIALMKEVTMITSHVSGSDASRAIMRNEIRALTTTLGMPSFYVTINPADVYNPLL
ncbi:hypothetical protein FPV67DRAFT_1410927, partial [Lyophyllum atratum]